MRGEALTQIRAFNDARKFLGAVDLEGFAETRGENGCGGGVEGFRGISGADVDETYFESCKKSQMSDVVSQRAGL